MGQQYAGLPVTAAGNAAARCRALRCDAVCSAAGRQCDDTAGVPCAVQVIFHEVPHNVGDFAILLQVSERSRLWPKERLTA